MTSSIKLPSAHSAERISDQSLDHQQKHISSILVLIMSIATGLSVASLYYAQPLLNTLALEFGLTHAQVGSVVTTAQVGYAFGLLFLVPLGDRFEHRRLIVTMTLLAAVGLALTAIAPNFTLILLATGLTALFSVVAQILLPFAATLAADNERGKVVGTVMSGLLMGLLLARTASGLLSSLGSWRVVYGVAAVVMILLAFVLYRFLPTYRKTSTLPYPQLILSVLQLFLEERVLRIRALIGGLIFAVFSVLWTTMAFLLAQAPYHYSDATIGLFGLIGAVGALAASGAGRLVDRGYGGYITTFGLVILILSWVAMAFAQTSLVALIVGILLLDLAVQAVHVSNLNEVFKQRPEARSRLNSGYMTSYFIGGAGGSILSANAFQYAGWMGVVWVGGSLSGLALLVWFLSLAPKRIALPS
jgi:predicted MFS family arabinose efflux permease